MTNIPPLITAKQIQTRIIQLAAEINQDYAGKNILLIGTLKGAYLFMADLSRLLTLPVEIDFLKTSSYGNSTEASEVKFDYPPLTSLTGKHILLVEDIVDTGHSLAFIRKYIEAQNPESLKVCALLDKPERREASLPPCEYLGFTIPNKFVIGYGLDFDQKYRNLPYIGVLEA